MQWALYHANWRRDWGRFKAAGTIYLPYPCLFSCSLLFPSRIKLVFRHGHILSVWDIVCLLVPGPVLALLSTRPLSRVCLLVSASAPTLLSTSHLLVSAPGPEHLSGITTIAIHRGGHTVTIERFEDEPRRRRRECCTAH